MFLGTSRPYAVSAPEDAARAFLHDNADLLRVPTDADALVHEATVTRRGVRHVRFRQAIGGVPVEGAGYAVHIRPDGRVDMANGTWFDGAPAELAPPTITAAHAASVAGVAPDRAALRGDDPTAEPHTAEPGALVVFPVVAGERDSRQALADGRRPSRFALAWAVTVRGADGPERVFVDAHSGRELERRSLAMPFVSASDGPASYVLRPERWEPRPAREAARSAPASEPSASQAQGTGLVYDVHPGQGARVSRTLENIGEKYFFFEGVRFTLSTGDVSAEDDDGDTIRQTTSTFNFTDRRLDEVNVFYHLERFRRLVLEPADLEGKMPGKHIGQVYDQSTFSGSVAAYQPSDGKMYFGDPDVKPDLAESPAREANIIAHEAVHPVTYYLGGYTGGQERGQKPAIEEGVGDYFAATYTGYPVLGDYALSPTSVFTPRDLTDSPPTDAEGFSRLSRSSQIEYFGATLWEIREHPGTIPAVVDELVWEAIARSPNTPSFSSFGDGLIAADALLNADRYTSIIQNVFAARTSYTPPGTPTGFQVVVSGPTCQAPGETLYFDGDVAGGGTPPYDYVWEEKRSCFGAVGCGSWYEGSRDYDANGIFPHSASHDYTYDVRLTVTDANGATRVSRTIHVVYDPEEYCGDYVTGTGAPSSAVQGPTQSLLVTEGAEAFAVGAVHPNPAAGPAALAVSLPEASAVRLIVFDALGRQVAASGGRVYGPGTHAVPIDTSPLPAGVYVVRVEAGGLAQAPTARTFTVAR